MFPFFSGYRSLVLCPFIRSYIIFPLILSNRIQVWRITTNRRLLHLDFLWILASSAICLSKSTWTTGLETFSHVMSWFRSVLFITLFFNFVNQFLSADHIQREGKCYKTIWTTWYADLDVSIFSQSSLVLYFPCIFHSLVHISNKSLSIYRRFRWQSPSFTILSGRISFHRFHNLVMSSFLSSTFLVFYS